MWQRQTPKGWLVRETAAEEWRKMEIFLGLQSTLFWGRILRVFPEKTEVKNPLDETLVAGYIWGHVVKSGGKW